MEEGVGLPSAGRAENAFFRYKSIIGEALRARSPGGQVAETLGRTWISIEINADYVASSRLRFPHAAASSAGNESAAA